MVRCLCICASFLPPSLCLILLPSSPSVFLCSPFYWKSNHCTKANWCLCQKAFRNRLSRRMESTEGGSPSPKSPDWAPGCPCGRDVPAVTPGSASSHHLPGCSQHLHQQIRAALLLPHSFAHSVTLKCHHEEGERQKGPLCSHPRGKMQCHSLHLFLGVSGFYSSASFFSRSWLSNPEGWGEGEFSVTWLSF